jgi:hypothetical protein
LKVAGHFAAIRQPSGRVGRKREAGEGWVLGAEIIRVEIVPYYGVNKTPLLPNNFQTIESSV